MEQITLIEVVLGDWQKLPEEMLALGETWRYIPASMYVLAQIELVRPLRPAEQALFARLKAQGAIVDGTARTQPARETPGGEDAAGVGSALTSPGP